MELIIALVVIAIIVLGVIGIVVSGLIEICEPNEVLVFSGMGAGRRGYRFLHAGRKVRLPLFQTVDRVDVTNMVIDINVNNAYSKGGIPLSLKGVANVKIGSQEPLISNATERFLGMSRAQIQQIAKETLEGNTRGVLATLTPEEVNDDRLKFARSLLDEAEHDLTKLGLVLDNLKIQHVSDDQGYLESIGRKQTASLMMRSRVAEATNRAESTVIEATNQLKKVIAQVEAQKGIAHADAERRVTDASTRGLAMVAEERSQVGSAIAKATAGLDVQRARLEQVKRQLAADVIQPARARKAELEANAKADAASIIENGKATVTALDHLIDTWNAAGEAARPIFLIQQFDAILDNMLSTIQNIKIDKITVIDSGIANIDKNASPAIKAASGSEQIKQTLGLDLPQLLQGVAAMTTSES